MTVSIAPSSSSAAAAAAAAAASSSRKNKMKTAKLDSINNSSHSGGFWSLTAASLHSNDGGGSVNSFSVLGNDSNRKYPLHLASQAKQQVPKEQQVKETVLIEEQEEGEPQQPKGKRSNICFASHAKQRTILSRSAYTEEEMASCWYTQEEQMERDDDIAILVEQLEMEQESPDGLQDQSMLRGLEACMEDGKEAVDVVVTTCIREVLQVQEQRWHKLEATQESNAASSSTSFVTSPGGSRQFGHNTLDTTMSKHSAYWELKIARASRKASQQCLDFAIEMAQYDHDEAMEAYRQMERNAKRSSKKSKKTKAVVPEGSESGRNLERKESLELEPLLAPFSPPPATESSLPSSATSPTESSSSSSPQTGEKKKTRKSNEGKKKKSINAGGSQELSALDLSSSMELSNRMSKSKDSSKKKNKQSRRASMSSTDASEEFASLDLSTSMASTSSLTNGRKKSKTKKTKCKSVATTQKEFSSLEPLTHRSSATADVASVDASQEFVSLDLSTSMASTSSARKKSKTKKSKCKSVATTQKEFSSLEPLSRSSATADVASVDASQEFASLDLSTSMASTSSARKKSKTKKSKCKSVATSDVSREFSSLELKLGADSAAAAKKAKKSKRRMSASSAASSSVASFASEPLPPEDYSKLEAKMARRSSLASNSGSVMSNLTTPTISEEFVFGNEDGKKATKKKSKRRSSASMSAVATISEDFATTTNTIATISPTPSKEFTSISEDIGLGITEDGKLSKTKQSKTKSSMSNAPTTISEYFELAPTDDEFGVSESFTLNSERNTAMVSTELGLLSSSSSQGGGKVKKSKATRQRSSDPLSPIKSPKHVPDDNDETRRKSDSAMSEKKKSKKKSLSPKKKTKEEKKEEKKLAKEEKKKKKKSKRKEDNRNSPIKSPVAKVKGMYNKIALNSFYKGFNL